jgi:hypothetical protein
MKKPVMILTSLVLATASSVATSPSSQSGAPAPDATDRKVQGLGKAGLMSPAQAQALLRARAAAAGQAKEANSTMPDQAKENAPAHQGGQSAPQSPPNGQAAPAVLPPTPPPPPEPPKWRLEGTMVGGQSAPSAMFIIDGWGEVLVHPGEKLNERTKIMAVHGKQVTLLTDGKKLERISPW